MESNFNGTMHPQTSIFAQYCILNQWPSPPTVHSRSPQGRLRPSYQTRGQPLRHSRTQPPRVPCPRPLFLCLPSVALQAHRTRNRTHCQHRMAGLLAVQLILGHFVRCPESTC